MGITIGIDLGTTNTFVSYVDKNGKVICIKCNREVGGGGLSLPSVSCFESRNEYYIGSRAKKMLKLNPAAGVRDFMTRIGNDEHYLITPYEGEPFKLRPRDIVKLFLNKLIIGIEDRYLKRDGLIDKAVIAVPADFNLMQKGEIRRAALEAGLDSVILISEPIAIAIAYEHDRNNKNPNSVILICNLDQYKFDVSIVLRQDNSFELIAMTGDKTVGDNALTERLIEAILKRIEDKHGLEMLSGADEYLLKMDVAYTADMIKAQMSSEEDIATEILPDPVGNLHMVTFTRAEYEDLIDEEINRMLTDINKVINDAKRCGVSMITGAILTGESEGLPWIKNIFESCLSIGIESEADFYYTGRCTADGAALFDLKN